MRKKTTLLLFVLLTFVSARAYDFEYSGIYYAITSEEEKTVSVTNNGEYGSYSGDIVIPSSVVYGDVTYLVTGIGCDVFWGCESLTSIEIPSSIIYICANPFRSCNSLSTVKVDPENSTYDSRGDCNAIIETETNTLIAGFKNTRIPDGVSIIGVNAFDSSLGLTSIDIPDGVVMINDLAFSECRDLEMIVIPSSVTYIGEGAFRACSNLTSIKVDSENTTYDSRGNCNALIETETNTLVTGCVNTVIPNDVIVIGNSAFESCLGLTAVDIPSSVTVIKDGAFRFCSNLESVTLPLGITTIPSNAFYGCYSLTSMEIPSSVITIENWAFCDCTSISITIPSTVVAIGEGAFFNVKNIIYNGTAEGYPWGGIFEVEEGDFVYSDLEKTQLKKYKGEGGEVVIPEGVTVIESGAFADSYGLTSVTIPSGVTTIGDNAFWNCYNLTSLDVPSSVITIGGSAFGGCYGLTSINVDAENEHYDSRNNCNAIIETETNSLITGCQTTLIPEDVVEIGYSAFRGCGSLELIVIPSSVTKIGSYAFVDCYNLSSLEIPSSVTEIGEDAFFNVKNIIYNGTVEGYPWGGIFEVEEGDFVYSDLEKTQLNRYKGEGGEVVIPDGVTVIEFGAFQGCGGLELIDIPSSVTKIGPYAFADCYNLSLVEIPSSVTEIGENAFLNVINLSYNGIVEGYPWGGTFEVEEGDFIYSDFEKTQLKKYKGKGGAVVIPDGVTVIGNSAFSSCTEMTSIVIPSSVISIGNEAFRYCIGLTSVEIPSSVTTIEDYAFYICYGLESLKIPSSVTKIGHCAFSQCFGLTSIEVETENKYYDSRNNCNAIIETETNTLIAGCDNTIIPDDVTSIGEGAFHSCDGLKSVIFPSGLTYIGRMAFAYCSGLKSIEIPENVREIDDGAFHGCGGLTSIIIPKNVVSIGRGAFNYCYSVTSISVDTDNTVYNSKNNCNAIIETETNALIAGCKTTIIPFGVTAIADVAFFGCSDLQSLVIPSSVTSIGHLAFDMCHNLTSIEIPSSVMFIGEWAFSGCDRLSSLSIYSETVLSEGAFSSNNIKKFFYNTNDESVVTTLFDGVWNIQDFIDNKTVVFVPAVLVDDYRATYNGVRFIGYNSSAEEEEVTEEEPDWSIDLDENSIEFIAETVNNGETLFGKEVAVSLKEDLDLSESEVGWVTIGTQEHPFKGELNGNGHTLILGNDELEGNVDNALFGFISKEASVKNVMIQDVYADYTEASNIKSADGKKTYYALLAKVNRGVIQNCVVKGNVADMNDETALACLVADNYGTIDHCVVYFTNLSADDANNKRKIIVMQNVGVGRTAGVIIKTASNGKKKPTSKAVTLGSDPKFSDADINSDYRIYSDEEMQTGEPAYWLNMSGQGYTGSYTGEWSMSSDGLFPVKSDEEHQKVIRIVYDVQGLNSNQIASLNLDGTSFAKVSSQVFLSYNSQPSSIDGVAATMDSKHAQFYVPEPDEEGVVHVTLKYCSTGNSSNHIEQTKVMIDGRNLFLNSFKGMVSVTDMMGRVVYTNPSASDAISLSLPSAGIYVVKAGDMNQKIVVR